MVDLHIVGNVHTVLEGEVTRAGLYEVSAHQFSFALGAGVFEAEKELQVGEAIIFENVAHIYTPDEKITTREKILTPFLMGIRATLTEQIIVTKEITLSLLYQELLMQYPKGFAISGSLHCSRLEVAYLKTPSIYHENINENKEKYWQQESVEDKTIQFFGIVTPKLIQSAFYQNPSDKSHTSFYSHTHALFEREARHLLTQSEIIDAVFRIEEIGEVVEKNVSRSDSTHHSLGSR